MANQILVNDYSNANVGATDYVSIGTTNIPTTRILMKDSSAKLVKVAYAKPLGASGTIDAFLVDQTITYDAELAGRSGNDVSIEIDDPGVPSSSLSVSVLAKAITVSLQTSAGVKATFTGKIAGMATNVTITADHIGVAGNSVSLPFDGLTTITAAILAWNTGNPSNTIALIAGNGSQTPTAAGSISLAGGVDSALISIAADVVNLINANSSAKALVVASTSAPSMVLGALVPTHLAGGADSVSDFGTPIDLFQGPVSGSIAAPLNSINRIPVGSEILLKSFSGTVSSGFFVATLLS